MNHFWSRLIRGIEAPIKWRRKINEQVPNVSVILSELQAESWAGRPVKELTYAEACQSMNKKRFLQHLKFVQQAGFENIYFWGVEWWLWQKEQGYSEIWDVVKKIVNEK